MKTKALSIYLTMMMLSHLSWAGNTIIYTSSDGKVVYPNSTTAFGAKMISDVYENGTGVITFDGEVQMIGYNAFNWCSSLTSIVIPSSVKSISNSAFSSCSSLASIEIPSSVTSIGDYAFWYCNSLTSIEIPSSITNIGDCAFSGCFFTKTSFVNKSSLTDSGNWGATIVDQITADGLIIDKNVVIGYRGYPTSVIIPEGVTSIGNNVFSNCSSLTSIKIPLSVTSISSWAFCWCSSLTLIEFPSSLTEIGDNAFYACNSLTSIVIPASVTIIGANAFSCYRAIPSITSIYVGDTPPTIASNTFSGAKKDGCILYVPAGCAEAYRNAPYWSEFQNIQEYIDSEDLSNVNNTLYAGHVETNSDSQCLLPICMKNDKIFTGFQCDVIIPNGFSFVFDEYGFAEADLVEDRISKKAMTFETETQSDGSLRLLAYSSKNIAFAGNDGEVAAVTLHISSDLGDGDYPILLKNIVLTEATGVTTKIDNVKSTITVFSYTLGDANGDGEVNVGDLATTASYILGNPPANFVFKGADANEDNEINVGDLAKIAGIILGTSSSKAPKRGAETETSFDMNMMLEPMSDNSYLLHVGVDNMGVSFSGFQFDLNLPDGLSVKTDADGFAEVMLSTDRTNSRKADLFDSRFMEDGQLRVLCASSHNALFEGESGEVATILLEADSSFDTQGIIALRNIVYTATGEGEKASDVELYIANDNSSIEMVNNSTIVTIYDMNGSIVKRGLEAEQWLGTLPHGIYVVDGKKVVR